MSSELHVLRDVTEGCAELLQRELRCGNGVFYL